MEDSTKKRSHGGDSMGEEMLSKKAFIDDDADNFNLKTLVPAMAAGAIIGKGGETIAEIQKNVGAKVKMSKSNDFYPGTNERVCLITGTKLAILEIADFLVTKIKEKPDHNAATAVDFDQKKSAEREKQIKVIVPNSTAGMIIGKAGSYINELKETSGSYIQLSQKAKETTLPERVVTIIGEEDNNRVALEMVLSKIMEDPQSGSCLNISYSDINGPIANANPTGSAFANGASSERSMSSTGYQSSLPQDAHMNGSYSSAGSMVKIPNSPFDLNVKLNLAGPSQPSDPRFTSQCLPYIHDNFRRAGYSDKIAEELTRALEVLSFHSVVMFSHTSPTENNPAWQQPGSYSHTGSSYLTGGPYGPQGLVSSTADRQGYGARNGSQGGSAYGGPVNNNSFGLATAGNPLPPAPPGEDSKLELEVEEGLVGAVLGQAGGSIREIQQYTGATIQISKKGVYAPGTNNRIVTITGSRQSIGYAKNLVEQKVKELEMKKKHNKPNFKEY